MYIKSSFAFLILLLLELSSNAQFSKGLISRTDPQIISINNFTTINTVNNSPENKYEKENPYTYVVMINHPQEEAFQILYQINFWGEVSFLALSNNAYSYFNCSQKSDLAFWNCIKKGGSSVLKSFILDEQLNCIIERLNLCN